MDQRRNCIERVHNNAAAFNMKNGAAREVWRRILLIHSLCIVKELFQFQCVIKTETVSILGGTWNAGMFCLGSDTLCFSWFVVSNSCILIVIILMAPVVFCTFRIMNKQI